ncbi:MAG: type IV secretory system conjugative DNA transfer family protein, partial [Nitrospira sp.]|nr:type IV secretory system conjugative DNA transfer family protein [Nitrospira sp.]
MNPDRLGTAQWADPEEVATRYAFREGAVWLGRTMPRQTPIGVNDDRHVCLVAGTRSGKGTSVIIPNLSTWPGSVVVIDPTGDNATLTAPRRGNGND